LKLLQKHSRSVLVTNLLIMLLGGVLFYLMFNYLIDGNIRTTLEERKAFARKKLLHSDSLYFYQDFSANVFSVRRLPAANTADMGAQAVGDRGFTQRRKEAQRAQRNTRSPCGLCVSFAPLRETFSETLFSVTGK
jgi:hypothetical protein